ncbi:hypothetical protein BN6_49590 [Saccharothrix espanaensis DSM 44229]|uniref:Uncharacterized protein n=1 Tax=Saccharothrix espanaensis (strain ATCC 51144 / DSM 44229 / JCM 9112 / NBRC 15066 / NRRL 15764) TaxID=1179773 RepID=K0K6N1_SACES|nr:hypothetical protein BN6_49590 [Saccharothrix espanaensis DSM 44229]
MPGIGVLLGAEFIAATGTTKRAEGEHHTQAVLALARRRVNVLWALPRDNRPYQPAPHLAAAA